LHVIISLAPGTI